MKGPRLRRQRHHFEQVFSQVFLIAFVLVHNQEAPLLAHIIDSVIISLNIPAVCVNT